MHYSRGDAALAAAVVAEKLRAGQSAWLRVSGGSMHPFLVAGQQVLVEPCPLAQMCVGQLIAFERDGRVILHRVLAVHLGQGEVTEKGDNDPASSVVRERQVVGRAVAVCGRHNVCQALNAGTGRWLAGLSALHARANRLASKRFPPFLLAARGFGVLLRLAAAFARPVR